MKIKGILKVLLFFAVGVLILWLITRNQDFHKIWTEIKNANFYWVLASVLSGFLSHYFRALRWNLLIESISERTPSTYTTFLSLMTGYLANTAVPRLGEITRCASLARYGKVPFNSIAGTVVAERVFDMICLLILIFLTVIFQINFLGGFLNTYVWEPFLVLINENLWLFLLFSVLFIALLTGVWAFLKRNFSGTHHAVERIQRLIKGFIKGMDSVRVLSKKTLFFFYSIVVWVFYLLMVVFVFYAFEGTKHLGIQAGFTILSLGSLGIVAPVPGGIGTYHFIVIQTLTELYNVSAEIATSYAYTAHASQIFMIIILGGLSYFLLAIAERKTGSDKKNVDKPDIKKNG